MDFFFYGTLCDAEVRRRVLDRELSEARLEEAELAGYRPVFVAGANYPTLAADPGGRAPGLLARGLGATDAARLAAFEGPAYGTRTLTVTGRRSGPLAARAFVARGAARASARAWTLDDWRRRFKPAFLAAMSRRVR